MATGNYVDYVSYMLQKMRYHRQMAISSYTASEISIKRVPDNVSSE